MKDPKNEDKTMEQLKAIVIKNLEKNPIYYTEKGQFGVKDLGYTMDAPGLGEPKEPKGKYKSSGYGNLNENKEPINEGILKRIKDKFFNKLVNLSLVDKLAGKIVDKMSPKKKEEFIKKYASNLNEGKVDDIMNKVSSLIDESSLEENEDGDKKNEVVQKVAGVLGKIAGINMMMLGGAPLAGILTYFVPGGILAFSAIAVINLIVSAIIMKMSQKITGKDPLSEETQIRKVVRSIINEELEEGYDDGEMGTYQSMDTRHYKNPQDMGTYLNAIKGMTKVEAIEHLGEEGLSSSMVMRVLNKADRMGMFDVQDMFDVNPRVRGDVFEDKEDDGFDEVWEKFKKDLRKRMGQPESPKNESLKESDDFNSRLDDVINNQYDGDPKVKEAAIDWNALQNVKMGSGREAYAPMLNQYWQDYGRETGNTGVMAAEEAGGFGFTTMYESKIRKVIRESVEKELAEINKLAEYEVFESKLEKIAELIERKSARLNRLDEDEDLKALTDKKKVKELQKDIKKLEKAKAKIEKALAKKAKSTPKKKEVIDEDEPLDEAELNEIDPKGMEAANDASADMAKNFKDIESSVSKIELEEEDDALEENFSKIKEKYPNVPNNIMDDFIKTHSDDLSTGVDPVEEFELFIDANPELGNVSRYSEY